VRHSDETAARAAALREQSASLRARAVEIRHLARFQTTDGDRGTLLTVASELEEEAARAEAEAAAIEATPR
jgi:hypothetical protein